MIRLLYRKQIKPKEKHLKPKVQFNIVKAVPKPYLSSIQIGVQTVLSANNLHNEIDHLKLIKLI